MNRKAFTVAEANLLLPKMEAVLSDIGHRIDRIQCTAERLQVLDVIWGTAILVEDNPDYQEAQNFRARITMLMGEIETIVDREIRARGICFPSGGLEYGLIDFPTIWQGRWVYLCWRQGEPSIVGWHETDEGFAGRHELTFEQIRMMGQEFNPLGDPDLPWAS
ncbi:MAG: DUF2203 domain-containing protein [Gemmatimonadota bacterium]|jgi:hypothetical protein|nr:DUF2203 domain-containing protein [Gemmatimonadota bacterium]